MANGKYKDLLREPTSRINDFVDETSVRISQSFGKIGGIYSPLLAKAKDSYFTELLDDFSKSVTKYIEMFKKSLNKISTTFFEKIGAKHGIESERGSKAMFWIYFFI